MIQPPGRSRLEGRVAVVARSDSPIGRASVERSAAEGASVHAVDEETCRRPRAVLRECLDAFGRLDVLLVAPSDEVVEPLADPPLDRYRAATEGSLRTAFFLAQGAAPRRSGRIVRSMPAPATIVEGGLIAMVRLLAVELAPNGIAVNAVCPIAPQADAQAIASALVFLASADASYVSGALIPVID
jgi:NAD(P)-dependent dehydrogenase (short-subunit alcohol dehydrogenase family)